MILPVESIYGGTWASGPPPDEFTDFELMHPDGMGWSWPDLVATPRYVRRYCWDILQARRTSEKDANDRAAAEAKRGR